MKKNTPRSIPDLPILTHDPRDSSEIALVPLAGGTGKTAKLDRSDYDQLQALDLHRGWYWNVTTSRLGGVVRCNWSRQHKALVVARLILDPRPNHCVFYRDGDALNLRRANLWVGKGKAALREHMALSAAREAQEEHKQWEARFQGMKPFERFVAQMEVMQELEKGHLSETEWGGPPRG